MTDPRGRTLTCELWDQRPACSVASTERTALGGGTYIFDVPEETRIVLGGGAYETQERRIDASSITDGRPGAETHPMGFVLRAR